jgi:hypothetical protein
MADNNIAGRAIAGANDPNQNTSTLKGFYQAPNPLFRVMNQQTVDDLSVLSDAKVGSFLRRHGKVGGEMATFIDATLDYFLKDKVGQLRDPAIKQTSAKRSFIPIIIKTDFKFAQNTSEKTPIYIVFDSTPDDISLKKNANWTSKSFLGRPEPVWTFDNSSATTFSLTGKFYAENIQVHKRMLKLSDYIMSLVTPSMTNYMPSPITVFIGEWLRLRCIVNSVDLKYSGPWRIADALDIAETQEAADNIPIPSHSPYMFEATLSLTVVGKDNEVKYAEQLASSEYSTLSNSSELTAADYQILNTMDFRTSRMQQSVSGLYSLGSSTEYTFSDGVITEATKASLDFTLAGKNKNIYDNSNDARRNADMGIISNAMSSGLLKAVQKEQNNPDPTSTTSKILKPFKKLL